MPKFKIALNTSAGELDAREVEMSAKDFDNDGEGPTITAALIAWLEDGLLVNEGDSITVSELP